MRQVSIVHALTLANDIDTLDDDNVMVRLTNFNLKSSNLMKLINPVLIQRAHVESRVFCREGKSLAYDKNF